MKRTLLKTLTQSMMLAGAVIFVVGCQKAPDTARIGSTMNRNGGLGVNAQSTPSGIVLNGIVTTDAQYQDSFQQEVDDFLEGSIDPQDVGTVSAQGANQTGVYVGGKVALASGQAYSPTMTGNQAITANSELLIAVYDRFADQTNLAPIPPIYLTQSSGYVSGSIVDLTFWDGYGTVELTGQIQGSVTVLKFIFDTTRTWNGNVGQRGQLGDLRVPTCQFFRCQ